MPLSPLQDLITRTALHLPEARTLALAGGAAMIVHGFVSRLTHDVDLFTEVDDREAVLVAAVLRTSLEQRGLATVSADRPPLDHRFVAVDPATGEECLVEVFADGGRLRQRVTLDVGAVLHPDDLAADKVLALWGRARHGTSSTSTRSFSDSGPPGSSSSPRRRTEDSVRRPSSTPSARSGG